MRLTLTVIMVVLLTACGTSSPDSSAPNTHPPRIEASWSMQFGSASNDFARGITKDSTGDMYVVGTTEGAFASHTSYGGNDAFIAKISARGELLWINQYGTAGLDAAVAITIIDDKLIVLERTPSTASATESLTQEAISISSLHPSGGYDWRVQFSTAGSLVAGGLASDTSGNIFVAATLTPEADPEGRMAVLVKFDSIGEVIWAKTLDGGRAKVTGLHVAVDNADEPVVSGNANSRPYVAKFASDGSLLWFEQFGPGGFTGVTGIGIDSHRNIYTTGFTDEYFTDETGSYNKPGRSDAFIQKFDANGKALWARQFGSADFDSANSIAIDAMDHIHVVGTYGNSGKSLVGDSMGFYYEFDAEGSQVTSKQFGTTENDSPSAVYIGPEGEVYIAGSTRGSFPSFKNSGAYDVFLLELMP